MLNMEAKSERLRKFGRAPPPRGSVWVLAFREQNRQGAAPKYILFKRVEQY